MSLHLLVLCAVGHPLAVSAQAHRSSRSRLESDSLHVSWKQRKLVTFWDNNLGADRAPTRICARP